jgi:hypothetical protein
MRTLCAWCANTISITCHCGAPLAITTYIGSTFDEGAMVCFNGETVLTYSRHAIEQMPISYGMCLDCRALDAPERDRRLIDRRKLDPTLPDHAAALEIAAASATATAHEGQTRASHRAQATTQKRGPTGVPRSATPPAPTDPKKSENP